MTRGEGRLLKKLRSQPKVYSREEAVELWYSVRQGLKKKFPGNFLKNPDHRRYITQAFIDDQLEERTNQYPTRKDWAAAKLLGLFNNYYKNSTLRALEEAGYTDPTQDNFDPVLDFAPWLVLRQMPSCYWHDTYNRANATRWLVSVTDKKPEELIADDFKDYGLSTLLQENGSSPYLALREAGFNIKEGDMCELPRGYWKVRKNRVAAVRRFVESSGKKPAEIIADDFDDAGLGGLMRHCKYSPIAALREAGYRVETLNRQHVSRGTWQTSECAREALIRAAKAEGKRPDELSYDDFRRHRLQGLLVAHHWSRKAALRFAGLDAPKDK